jgi:hypothetical protein
MIISKGACIEKSERDWILMRFDIPLRMLEITDDVRVNLLNAPLMIIYEISNICVLMARSLERRNPITFIDTRLN